MARRRGNTGIPGAGNPLLAGQPLYASGSLQQLGRSGEVEQGLAGADLEQILRDVAEYDQRLKAIGASGKLATTQISDGFGNVVRAVGLSEQAVKHLRAEMERLKQEQMALRGPLLGPGAPGGGGGLGTATSAFRGDLGGIFQSAGLAKAAGALAAFTAAIHTADQALKLYTSSFVDGRFSPTKLEDTVQSRWADLPLVGGRAATSSRNDMRPWINPLSGVMANLPGLLTEGRWGSGRGDMGEIGNTPLDIRQKQLQDAFELAQEAKLRVSVNAPYLARQRDLAFERSHAEAQLRYGATSQGAAFGYAQGGSAATEAAQAAVGYRSGYDRLAQQQDIARRYGLETSLQQQGAEGERRRDILGAEQKQARYQTWELANKRSGQQDQVTTAERNLAQARNSGLDENEQLKARLTLQARATELLETERRLQEAMTRERELQNQQQQLSLQLGQEKLGLLLRERDTLTGIIQQGKQRMQGTKEEFGLLRPVERGAVLQVATKISKGLPLTYREMELAKGHSNIFGEELKRIGALNAGPEYEALKRLPGFHLPETERVKEAEKLRLELDNKIHVQIDMNAKDVADQLQKQLLPGITNAFAQVKQAMEEAIRQAFRERKGVADGAR